MTTYREEDGYITREYRLESRSLLRRRTGKAFIEIVPTKEYGLALFIDNELQLTEKDEYIYHEALVHPCLAATPSSTKQICIIGGGDGCALREVLKWRGNSTLYSIDMIDYDSELVNLFRDKYARLNQNALLDLSVHIETVDIRTLLHEERAYNCILIDLLDPDPDVEDQEALWYDILFMARSWILTQGTIVINAGGITPWNTRTLNWLVDLIQRKFSSWHIHLYKAFVPSFGREWCYILLSQSESLSFKTFPPGLSFLSPQTWKHMYTYGWTPDYQRRINLNISNQLNVDE